MEAAAMNPVLASMQSLREIFVGKAQAFCSEIDNVHMVWLEEIQQEANRMFTKDFNAEPELMPKTPSQKRNTRRKRVSLGRQEENQTRRRFSKGRRSNLRGSSSNALNCIAEEENSSQGSTSKTENTRPKRATRKKQTKSDEEEAHQSLSSCTKSEEVVPVKAQVIEILKDEVEEQNTGVKNEKPSSITESPKNIPSPKVVVAISPEDRLSAELAVEAETSPGHAAVKAKAAEPAQDNRSHRSSVRHSLKLRHSVAGLRCSLTQESVRRASRRSMLKRKTARMGNSTCGSNTGDDSCMDSVDEENEVMVTAEPVERAADTLQTEENTEETASVNKTILPPLQPVGRITRSVAANSPKLAPQPLFAVKIATPDKRTEKQQTTSGRLSTKRKAPDMEESPTKRASPPKKSQSAIRPHMKSFLHTVQKNQMLMMTPSSLGRSTVLKSFIKNNTPLKMDQKTKERCKLEALKKKQEQEIERIKKMEEEKKKKQEELKRKRDERQRRVFEAKEQKEEEKKKKMEQKLAQIDEKNDKRLADEKKKKVLAMKRQEELELKKKEEEAKKKFQQDEEKRQLEAKKKAEEEERAQKLAEAHKALELKREQERERERERQAAAERERVEREKVLALQRELERAAREKERRELEERRKALEEKRKLEKQLQLAAEEKAAKEREAAKQQAPPALNVTVDIERSVMGTPVGKTAGLNVTVDVEKSPQSYSITPKGGNKIPSKNPEDYGMDQNSDDSTDDESAPRKPIPSWAEGHNLQMLIKRQYFSPPKLDAFFGKIEPPNLESIFYKSKPRYFKRTSSAVWHSPPGGK